MSQQPEASQQWDKLVQQVAADEVGMAVMPNEVVTYAADLIATLRAQVERLQAEVNEQARLNGMGGERELALMARVERLQASTGANVDAGMVPLTDEWIVSIAEDLGVIGPRSRVGNLHTCIGPFARAIEAEIAKLNGLTVGGIQASGRVGK